MLEEGVRLAGNMIDCPLSLLEVAMPAGLAWSLREGRLLPVFKPAD